MAERRMFAKTIIESDAFIDMPSSTQNLYFHLAMRADDDGFVNSPKSIMRIVGGKDYDMGVLIMKKFIIPFENGIVVIKHWKIHNYIQSDRYTPTKYLEQKEQLELDENKAYRLPKNECIQNVSTMDTQVSIDKDSIVKVSKDKGVFETYSNDNLELFNALKDFEQMRNHIKAPMTDRARKMICTQLDKLKEQNQNIIECINKSIVNNWKDIYAIQEKINYSKPTRNEPIPDYNVPKSELSKDELDDLKVRLSKLKK